MSVRVETLLYRIKIRKDVTFNFEPYTIRTPIYVFDISPEKMLCSPLNDYPDVVAARTDLELFLKSWEIDSALSTDSKDFTFIYESASLRDPDQPNVIFEEAEQRITVTATGGGHVIRNSFPTPPSDFHIKFDVELLWFRYEAYLQKRETLQSMGYFCLSYLEHLCSIKLNRKATRIDLENTYKIKKNVLDRLGDLTSAKGDVYSTRKGKDNSFQSLTTSEVTWIEKCVKTIIHRIGESNPSKLIELTDFPPI